MHIELDVLVNSVFRKSIQLISTELGLWQSMYKKYYTIKIHRAWTLAIHVPTRSQQSLDYDKQDLTGI